MILAKQIKPHDLVRVDEAVVGHPIKVDLVYAKATHPLNMFQSAIYRPDAHMWAHAELMPIILAAADICYKSSGYLFELKDILRTCEAQGRICDSDIVRAHPEWLVEPRLFSPPGAGAHPRGMAVDIILVNENGDTIDMGTDFDYLTPDKAINPAARNFTDFGKGDAYNKMVQENRGLLETSVMAAAAKFKVDFLPLPQEWWDFRFPPAYSNQFSPVYDRDLPDHMKMT